MLDLTKRRRGYFKDVPVGSLVRIKRTGYYKISDATFEIDGKLITINLLASPYGGHGHYRYVEDDKLVTYWLPKESK